MLYDSASSLVHDEIFLGDTCTVDSGVLPLDVGLFAEGAALLGEFTGNDTLRDLCVVMYS